MTDLLERLHKAEARAEKAEAEAAASERIAEDFATCIFAYADNPKNEATWLMLMTLCARVFDMPLEIKPNPAESDIREAQVIANQFVAETIARAEKSEKALREIHSYLHSINNMTGSRQEKFTSLVLRNISETIDEWKRGDNHAQTE